MIYQELPNRIEKQLSQNLRGSPRSTKTIFYVSGITTSGWKKPPALENIEV